VRATAFQLPRHEARWLRQREFETAQIENAEAQAVGLTKARVFVATGTRAFDAWVKFGHKQTLTSRDEANGKTGWWFSSEFRLHLGWAEIPALQRFARGFSTRQRATMG
jgi:hypothetical protein